MPEVFDKLTPPQLTAVICTVAGVVALVVFIVSIWSYQVRALADQTALQRERQNADIAMQKEQVQADLAMKQELVKRNLPPEELRLALEAIESVSAASGEEAEEEDDGADDTEDAAARVLKQLTSCADEVDGKTVEETVALVAAADPSTLQTLGDVLDDCIANGQSADTLYAVARALCKSAAKKPESPPAKAERVAAAEKPPIDLQFERSFGAS
jgi:hypothetical protein